MADKKIQEEIEDIAPRLYEVGFHLLPTISEGELAGAVSKIQATIEAADGKVTDSAAPETLELAYAMSCTIANKKHTFDTAYFGWIKFETTPFGLEKMKGELDLNEDILRMLITQTTADSTLVTQQLASIKKQADARKKSAEGDKKEEKKDESKTSEKELDKTIEELVIE